MLSTLRKFARFVGIYGFARTWSKATGRLRIGLPGFFLREHGVKDIAIVGCGQYAYATIGYFLTQEFGHRIALCYDTDPVAQQTFERNYGIRASARSFDDLLALGAVRTLYIASNHASHVAYATQAIKRGADVYIEKPIAVTCAQLTELCKAMRQSSSRVFAGYNRPFSPALLELRDAILIESDSPFSINCFISGHKIPPGHWYRDPKEGSRICGNVGHWLDLVIHILSWRGLPNHLRISLAVANESEPDDNLTISITSDKNDLASIMLTSRCEPFEGINETINIQHGATICKIDDFRRISIWQGSRLIDKAFSEKDCGHRSAILQPFLPHVSRKWNEVVLSTLLMLHIADMVCTKTASSVISLQQIYKDHLNQISDDSRIEPTMAIGSKEPQSSVN